MLKKRLIFVLYYDSGCFYLSRNFRLQKVGDVRWLVDKFRFKTIGRFIDEIVVLDVGRIGRNEVGSGFRSENFSASISYLMKETFVPLTLGGGIRSMEDVRVCFSLGADKILINTQVLLDPKLVRECIQKYGAQAVIGGIDCCLENGSYVTRIKNASEVGESLENHLRILAALEVGEIFLNSIDKDGTGMGFDLDLVDHCVALGMPLILCGGAGKPVHFAQALDKSNVEAVATGNLFNFIGSGFELVRNYLVENNYNVRKAIP